MVAVGIPTEHSGSRFRSRLEARWASMFDLLGWEWEYEPFDLDGYIPDFAIRTSLGPLIVEVKPIVWPPYLGNSAEHMRIASEHTDKAKAAGLESLIVLGTSPIHDIALGLGKIFFADSWYGLAACLCGKARGWVEHCTECHTESRSVSGGMTTLFRRASNKVQWRAP